MVDEKEKEMLKRRKKVSAIQKRQWERLGIEPPDQLKRPLNCYDCVFSVFNQETQEMTTCAAQMDFDHNGMHYQPQTTYECERMDNSNLIMVSGKEFRKDQLDPFMIERYFLEKYKEELKNEPSALDKEVESLGDIDWADAINKAESISEMATTKTKAKSTSEFSLEGFKGILHPGMCSDCDHTPEDCESCMAPFEDGWEDRVAAAYDDKIPEMGVAAIRELMLEDEDDDDPLEGFSLEDKVAAAETYNADATLQKLIDENGFEAVQAASGAGKVSRADLEAMIESEAPLGTIAAQIEKDLEKNRKQMKAAREVFESTSTMDSENPDSATEASPATQKEPERKKCMGKTRKGLPCRRWAEKGADFCPAHQEDGKKAMAELAESGNKAKKEIKERREEAIMGVIMDEIKDKTDLKRKIAQVMRDVQAGIIESDVANVIINASKHMATLMDDIKADGEDIDASNLSNEEVVDMYFFAKRHPKLAAALPLPKKLKADVFKFDFSKAQKAEKIPTKDDVGWYAENEKEE